MSYLRFSVDLTLSSEPLPFGVLFNKRCWLGSQGYIFGADVSDICSRQRTYCCHALIAGRRSAHSYNACCEELIYLSITFYSMTCIKHFQTVLTVPLLLCESVYVRARPTLDFWWPDLRMLFASLLFWFVLDNRFWSRCKGQVWTHSSYVCIPKCCERLTGRRWAKEKVHRLENSYSPWNALPMPCVISVCIFFSTLMSLSSNLYSMFQNPWILIIPLSFSNSFDTLLDHTPGWRYVPWVSEGMAIVLTFFIKSLQLPWPRNIFH